MPIFALTGHWASGKSTVLKLLRRKGAVIFDADKIVHAYYRNPSSAVYKKVIAAFPGVSSHAGISRKKLGLIVFCDRKKLVQLERIVHPVIIRDLKCWIRGVRKHQGIYVAEVPLLFEKGLERYFDGVIVVSVKAKIMRDRLRRRVRLSGRLVDRRLSLYMPLARKKKIANFVVDNNSSLQALRKKINIMWRQLQQYQ